MQAARAKFIQLNALKAGPLPPDEVPFVDEPARLTMNSAINDYLEYIRKHRSLLKEKYPVRSVEVRFPVARRA
ncbi:MAG: hypothetical protein ABSG62_14500 [Terracidiphilus sp.]